MPADRSKSHLGCSQCKKRKVKCDEGTPSCSNCVRRQEKCSLLETKLYLLRQHGIAQECMVDSRKFSQQSSIAKSVRQEENKPLSSGEKDQVGQRERHRYTELDLEFTHYFSTKTYRTIMFRPLIADVWRDRVFGLSLEWPHLLGGLLATAAMHRIIEEPNNPHRARYIEYAIEKQSELVSVSANMIQEPSEENCVVLLVATILLSVWAFAGRQLPKQLSDTLVPMMTLDLDSAFTSKRPVLVEFLGVVNIVQGVYGVSVGMYSWIHKQGYGVLMDAPIWTNLLSVPREIEHSLLDLEEEIREYGDTGDEAAELSRIMLATMDGLRSVFRSRQDPEWLDMTIGWPITLPKQVVGLLSREHPLALVMLAHWAWCLHDLNFSWWLQGWAVALYHELRVNLPNRWARHLLVHSASSVR